MKIEIKRSGMSLGFFTEEEVERGVEIGRFIRSDKWRYEDSDEWMLVSDFVRAKMNGLTPGEVSSIPWEDESEELISRFFSTVKLVLLEPGRAFAAMKRKGFKTPLIFGAAGTITGFLINYAYQLLLNMATTGTPPPQLEQFTKLAASGFFVGVTVAIIIILVPLALFLGAGIDHLMLLLLGGAKKGFETTFSVFSYASGATGLLNVIPFCGSLIAYIWHLVARIIGYSKAHEISGVRATIAVLLPGVLCCACAGALIAGIVSLAGYESFKESLSHATMTMK